MSRANKYAPNEETFEALPSIRQRSLFELAKKRHVDVEPLSNLGLMVKEARGRLGLSQASLAERSGVGRRFVAEMESGKSTLRYREMAAVLRTLGFSLGAQLTWDAAHDLYRDS